jgi:hypothetical protein
MAKVKTKKVNESKPNTIKRHIDFEGTLYAAINKATDLENNRRQLFSRNTKMHLQDMIPVLTGEGIKFREGKIYTPEDKFAELSEDETWISLRTKAELALEKFHEYQNKKIYSTT